MRVSDTRATAVAAASMLLATAVAPDPSPLAACGCASLPPPPHTHTIPNIPTLIFNNTHHHHRTHRTDFRLVAHHQGWERVVHERPLVQPQEATCNFKVTVRRWACRGEWGYGTGNAMGWASLGLG